MYVNYNNKPSYTLHICQNNNHTASERLRRAQLQVRPRWELPDMQTVVVSTQCHLGYSANEFPRISAAEGDDVKRRGIGCHS